MQSLEENLFGFVGMKLYGMAKNGNYPLHPSVGLWSLFEAFRKSGADVNVSNDTRIVSVNTCVSTRDRVFSLETTMGFNEILDGSRSSPVGCLNGLVHSASGVYDQFWDSLPKRYHTKKLRKEMEGSVSIKDRLGLEVSDYFEKFHENTLLSGDGSTPNLVEPLIIHEVLGSFPLEVFSNAISLSLQGEGFNSPTPEDLLEGGILGDFDDEYHPSEDCLKTYFWGLYLEQLVFHKGFKLRPGMGNPLKAFVNRGEGAILSGNDIWKGARHR